MIFSCAFIIISGDLIIIKENPNNFKCFSLAKLLRDFKFLSVPNVPL